MDFISHPYAIIGILVYVIFFNKIATVFANTGDGLTADHPDCFYRDRGFYPTTGNYIVTILWGPAFILLWPLCLLIYFIARSKSNNKGTK